jgi:hypothetical protein
MRCSYPPYRYLAAALVLVSIVFVAPALAGEKSHQLTLSWANNFLTIRGSHLPGGELKVHYLEAYCRPGSTDREWGQTVIKHKTELLSCRSDGSSLKLRCMLADGVVVNHEIIAGEDEVSFRVEATNPTAKPSETHWAQPCIRVQTFTGKGQKDYLPQCFIFIHGKLARMPTRPWAERARYTPGQVYCPVDVDRRDVNPRPLSPLVPDNGLIGCYSADGKMLMATAWEPYQELFQGVVVCVHSDFRIGGLKPGESKNIRGKIYLVSADPAALLRRYARDFPEHVNKNKP